MIEVRQGDLLQAQVEALVNSVNTVGVMGKGVALQFKHAFPDNFGAYVRACKRGEVQTGSMFVYTRPALMNPKYIVNFPTKRHWRERSRLEYVEQGLCDLVRVVRDRQIGSIAVPPLGCGNGGLDWREVRPLIDAAFADLPDVHVLVYEPTLAHVARSLATEGKRPTLTPARAVLVALFSIYRSVGEEWGRLEAQKLAYFVQSAGMDLRLTFVKNRYGPYDDRLNHVLQRLEGHYFTGYGDRSDRSRMHLREGAAEAVERFLASYSMERAIVKRVAALVQGFETPYGLELLATVHWVATCEKAEDLSDVLGRVQAWSARKRHAFSEHHVRIAWEHLRSLGWLASQHVPA